MFAMLSSLKGPPMRRLAVLALIPLIAAQAPPPKAAKPKTPNDIVAAAPRSDWREIAAEDLVLALQDGTIFFVECDEGVTGLVFIGRGEMRLRGYLPGYIPG